MRSHAFLLMFTKVKVAWINIVFVVLSEAKISSTFVQGWTYAAGAGSIRAYSTFHLFPSHRVLTKSRMCAVLNKFI